MATKEYSILLDINTKVAAVTSMQSVHGLLTPYKEPQRSVASERPYANIGMSRTSEIESANSKTVKTLDVSVEVIGSYDPENPSASISAIHELIGFVDAALMADPSRGGYAIMTSVASTSRPSAVESSADKSRPGYVSAELDVSVDFGHSITDPSSD